MKDQLISVKTDRIAKEKGYKPENPSTDYVPMYVENDLTEGQEEDWDVGYRYLASTQTTLQTWLREEHNAHIYAYPVALGNYKCCHFKGGGYTLSKSEFLTYEEAVEYGLIEELKNIYYKK